MCFDLACALCSVASGMCTELRHVRCVGVLCSIAIGMCTELRHVL